MKNRFTYRCLSLLMAWMLLFTLLPVQAIAGETSGLSVRAKASVSHVYVGEGAVAITAEIAGGAAPYEVTIQAVQNGNVVFKDQMMTTETRVTACFTPEGNGDYELVTVVCDVEQNQVLDSVSLAVAEHDAETEADWAASVSGASVSGDWASSLLSVARSQLGYQESGKDFIVKSGAKQGYNRYGDWFGMPYGDWNNAFLLFAAEYAGIPGDALLSGASSSRWGRAMQAKGAYMMPGSYVPQAGDVAFLSGGRAAVIERVSGDSVQVIEGDVKGEVVRKNYAVSKLAGIGNTRLMMGLYRGTATAVPAAPAQTPADGKPARTAVPAAKPTVTPEPAEEEELTFTATATPRPGMTTAPKEDGTPLDGLIDAAGGVVAQLQAAATSVPTVFSEAFYLMQAEVHKVTERYLGEGAKNEAEVKAFADKLTLPEVYYLRVEMDALEDYAASIDLTAWEGNALWEREETFRRLNEAVEDRWISLVQPRAEQILLDGKATFSCSLGDSVLNSDDSLTWTAVLEGKIFNAASKTYTLTFTNNYDCPAVLEFDWTGEGFTKIFEFSVSTIGNSGSVQQKLDAGKSYQFTVNATAAAGKEQTSILTLTNITLTPEAQNGRCTLQFDVEKGSVTVYGAAAANGSGWDVDASAGLALTAAATEGCSFLGWVDQADGKVQSCEESFTLQASGEISVEAVFVKAGENTWFGVSDRGTSGDMATGYTSHVNAPVFLFDDLSKAADCAAAGQYPCIVLLNGGTLPAGGYTIPEKVTLLIPFDDARTLYLGSPASTEEKTTPQAYRTLNMAAGASLTVNGTLSLSAKHQYASADGGSARPIGSYGHIAMAEGSSITVGSGGKLYAWGYITGKGEVTAESGAEVYEIFQIADFRGAVAQSMKNGVYPFSQYYVENIEVPLKLYAGATEYGLTSASVSGTASSSTFPFMGGSGAMFQQTSGYLVKDYREGTDRLNIDANGSMTLSGLQMELAGVRVDAADFVLPVNSNMTVTAHSGEMTIDQDLALLPGAELVIGTAAEAVIAQDCSVYAYDAEDWGAYAWSGGTDAKLWVAPYAPGRESTRTAAALTDAKLHIKGKLTVEGGLYTTKGGAEIIGTSGAMVTLAPGKETQIYQLRQSEGANTYQSIDVTSARLKNADGSYALTEHAADESAYTCKEGCWTCGTWTLTEGVWSCTEASPHAALITQAEIPPTCEKDGTTAGAYCEVCGYIGSEAASIPMTGHSLPEDWTITPATCTEDGQRTRKCQNTGCTYEEEETIEAQGHAWSEWTESRAASCTVAGEKTRACPCGEVETETLPALDHDWSAATCTASKTCETCGVTEGNALGHTYRDEQGELLASEGEYTQYKCGQEIVITYTCTRCAEGDEGHTYEHQTGEMLEHDMVYEDEVPATCEADGSAGSGRCTRGCGYTTGGTVIPALGHDWTPATCTTPKTCKREGCGITEGEALGHSWTTATCTDAKRCTTCKLTEGEALGHDWADATCTTPQTCKTCGATQGFELGHTTIIDAGKDPTCTEAGLTVGSHCSVCGEVIVAQKMMSPMNHNWTPATCTTPKSCKREGCGITEGEALGHSWTAATCTDAKRCTTCKLTEGEALGHDWIAATCTIKKTCTTCGATQGFELGHTIVIDAGKDPTCTESGLTEGSHCSVCGEVIVAQKMMSPMNHNWTPATCTAPKTCKREGCGITEGEALGHSWTAATCTDAKRCTTCKLTEGEALGHDWIAATCTTKKTCTTCGATQGFELGHTIVIDAGKDPTCTESGLTEGSHCVVCGKIIVAQTVIEATAHANKYAGYGFEPDCTRAGWNAGLYCPDCDTWLEEQTEIPPLGHDLGKGVEAIPPTCTQSGVMAYPCQRCSYVASEDILPRHTPVKIEAVSPTEDKEGATEGSKCSACGKILVQPEVIPALGRPTPEGWASEEGGWRYYADGAYLTGIAVVDGLYFDFGESGLNLDKTPYTGLLAVDGENYYIRKGKLDTGWQLIGESWYYFDTTTGAGLDGEHLVSGQIYPFEKGRLLRGVWVRDDVGLMYFYGPGNYDKGWKVIEGEEYFFQRGYVTTGIAPVRESQDKPVYWYAFTDAGVKLGYASDGFHWYEGELYYIVDGLADRFGMYCIDGDYYYFTYDDYAVRGRTFEVVQTNGLPVRKGQYRFDEAGCAIMTTEIVAENGKLVYYQKGVLTRNTGLVQVDNAYYYIDGEGVAVTNKTLLVEKTNGLVPVASYTFGADGRMQVRLPGDANQDYAIGADDAATAFAYAAEQTVDIDLANADVNADGKVNELDGLLIMQYAAGWEGVLR